MGSFRPLCLPRERGRFISCCQVSDRPCEAPTLQTFPPTSHHYFFLSEFHFYFPSGRVHFLSVLFVPTAQIGLCRGDARACRVRSCGWMPGARLHHQQITPSPQPTTAPLRLLPINRAMTSRLETSFAAGSSTPMHFLFPVKILFPAPTQDRGQLYQHPLHTDTVFSGRYFHQGSLPFPSPV